MSFCKSCGQSLDAGIRFCPKCGVDTNQSAVASSSSNNQAVVIKTHLVQAILVTIFCCVPFGIISIVHAASVNGKVAAGDIQGAIEASKKAQSWSIWAMVSGLTVSVIYIVILVVAGEF